MVGTTIRQGERTGFIPVGTVDVPCILAWPVHPSGIVVFAHDTGSGRFCPHDRAVAARFRRQGLATLQFDLLRPREAGNPARVFDVALLARRLLAAAAWVSTQEEVEHLPLALFGTGMGAAAALVAAAERPGSFAALALLSTRADMAECAWPSIKAPALLIVGSRDAELLTLNREAADQLTCARRLFVVPGVSQSFEEHGALDDAAAAATEWLVHHLAMEPAWHGPALPVSLGPRARQHATLEGS